MFDYLQAVPAYGRDYPTAEEILEAWEAGKDFRFAYGGPYFSIRDIENLKKDYYIGVMIHTEQTFAQIDF